ncbi:MAG: tol-pal system protein YbgF [Gammaproteobacteria bacterium]|nr:MAG: tol-pal system protein YbgF [Gammaproteobacteria bacterium]
MNREFRTALLTIMAAFALLLSGAAAADTSNKELSKRMARIERMVSSKLLLDMSNQIQQLQDEVRKLRGELDETTIALEKLKKEQRDQFADVVKRQKDLYSDIDRRLYKLEVGEVRENVQPINRDGVQKPVETIEQRQVQHSPATQGGVDIGSEVSAYKAAFELLREGRYQLAADKFTRFLQVYPSGTYADNAQYWLGEANYVVRNFEQAKQDFKKVVENFPKSQKVSDAMLKIGYIYYEEGNWEEAKKNLQAVKDRYPNTTAANLANNRLVRMKREGR